MSTTPIKKEVRFSVHIPKSDYRDDIHYIREDHTLEDGTVVPHTYLVKDWKRPVYVVKQQYQNYIDKKEFEDKDKLNVQLTTQSDINRTVANMLGTPHLATQQDKLKSSPYLYGYDITSTSLIKLMSLRRNEFVQSPYSVASFDIETNPLTNEILMATITYKNKSYTAIMKSFLKNIPDPNYRLKLAIEKYLPNYKDLDFKLSIHNNQIDLLKDIFKVANEWAPAFMSIWNMDFDISRIMEVLKKYNVNPVDVICDQSIPRYARVCRYKQGPKKKVTASGLVKPINPSLQWHSLISTSKFYVIDAMCVYRQLRIAKPEKPSYSLDAILRDELNTQKLKFKEADDYKAINWHLFMQENYPIEYIVYNIYDCLSMLELDEKNKDIASTLPAFAGITDFQKFSSQVRKITDAMFLFGLERNKIIGTAGKKPDSKNNIDEEIDDSILDDDDSEENENDPSKYKTLDLKGWIQLLPQNLLLNEGLKCIEEYPDVTTNVRGITCDLDASSSYPSCTLVANVSKKTCVNELIKVEGIPEKTFREQNLSICLGNANMLEYCNVMLGLPSIDTIDKYLNNSENVLDSKIQ